MKRGGVELTMQLSDEDAKRMKARPVKQTTAPKGDEEKVAAEEQAKAEADAKAVTPANKARAPQNK